MDIKISDLKKIISEELTGRMPEYVLRQLSEELAESVESYIVTNIVPRLDQESKDRMSSVLEKLSDSIKSETYDLLASKLYLFNNML